MGTVFIEDVLLNDRKTNILIEGNHIASIGPECTMPANAIRVEGLGKAVFPSFANMHTHAAMNLFRGYANDLPLMTWLNDWIWPKEKRLNNDLIYWGVRLAATEMIKSGTTLFNDMYFMLPAAAKGAGEMGLRGVLGYTFFGDAQELTDELVETLLADFAPYGGRIQLAIAPHAIYTVSEKGLLHCASMSRKYHLPYHVHVSETEEEVNNCLKVHGCRPYEWLEQIGVLDQTEGLFVGAHSLHLSENEIAILGRHHATVVHNPCSNLKLGSGHFFPYCELVDAGANVTLGTDGCSSSNNLDMIDAAKFMSYLQKGIRQDATILPANELLQVASRNGFKSLGLEGGEVKIGMLADLMLIDLDNLAFVPNNESLANLFYAAHGDAVDTVICDGNILMQHRRVEGEEQMRHEVSRATKQLFQ